MEVNTPRPEPIQPRLRAMLEIRGDEIEVLPVAETEQQAEEILAKVAEWAGRQ